MAASSALLALTLAAAPNASLQQFETVLAQDSATRALEQWCATRHIADPPVITARKLNTVSKDPPRRIRRLLGVGPNGSVTVRHVRLSCGGTALSVAWNWYVPDRLTATMNTALRDSDVPFGKVVAALRFRREALASVPGRAEGCPAGTISTHRARLVLPDGRALAYVIECYTGANLRNGAR